MIFNYLLGSSLTVVIKNKGKWFGKKKLLSFEIVSNVLLLGYFKYADFFIVNVNLATDSEIVLLNLSLPLAISFLLFSR